MMARLHSLISISYMTYLHEEDSLTLARFAGSHNEFSFNAIFRINFTANFQKNSFLLTQNVETRR